MSFKRRAVYEFIRSCGPAGVSVDDLKEKFFASCKGDMVIRSTIFYINKAIAPLRIHRSGGIIRLLPKD